MPKAKKRDRRTLKPKRAAIYARVSTDKQTTTNQIKELRAVAERHPLEQRQRAAFAADTWFRYQKTSAPEFRHLNCAMIKDNSHP